MLLGGTLLKALRSLGLIFRCNGICAAEVASVGGQKRRRLMKQPGRESSPAPDTSFLDDL